jgi:excisionase family DNA binding protein
MTDPKKPPLDTMSVDETAKRLGISRNSAYQAIREGEIPFIRFGKLLRVPVKAFERMLEEAGK